METVTFVGDRIELMLVLMGRLFGEAELGRGADGLIRQAYTAAGTTVGRELALSGTLRLLLLVKLLRFVQEAHRCVRRVTVVMVLCAG